MLLSFHMSIRDSDIFMQRNGIGGIEMSTEYGWLSPKLLPWPPSPLPMCISQPDISVEGMPVLLDMLRRDCTGTARGDLVGYFKNIRTKGGRMLKAESPFSLPDANDADGGDGLAELAERCLEANTLQDRDSWDKVFSKCSCCNIIQACAELCGYRSAGDEPGALDKIGQQTCAALMCWFSQRFSVGERLSRDGSVRAKKSISGSKRRIRHYIDTYIHKQLLVPLRALEADEPKMADCTLWEDVDASLSILRSAGVRQLRIVTPSVESSSQGIAATKIMHL